MTPRFTQEDVLVRAQETPNPFAIKFIMNHAVKEEGKATFYSREECEQLPLAFSLFDIKGVKQLYFFENTITMTHDGSLDGDTIEQQAFAVIKSRLPIHDAGFRTPDEVPSKGPVDRSHLSEELQRIEEILDRTIRPGLQADGGDLEVLEYIDNEIKILYQGACGGCPSAMMGTLDAIQSILRHELGNPDLIVYPI
ncbi:MAG: NifU family protein [Bdellovibrionaceae bacterium]|nr:NifU family protein [Bdellovibrionales bacterium]MCB9085297.1 NifU family protein [Pseudobdellovibrionaceae bacterium]